MTEKGAAWHPVGQNDSVTWVDLAGLWRRDLGEVRGYFDWLREHGVTCLRLMLEYAETGEHFFEQPAGHFNPAMVRVWDDVVACARGAGLRLLLTPLDTYFHWVRWDLHPYNAANGGPCPARTSLMVHPEVRGLVKARLEFATRRWGGDGTVFAWDLWNEMHPVQGEDRPDCFEDYIGDVGPFLRGVELEAHGKAHLQTVSVFGPELGWKPWLNGPVFRHGALDAASSHFYDEDSIDHPADTVAPAVAVARLVREALAEIRDGRPFFESEHGPIHTFKDHRVTLQEAFDDEYFRHMQWAHLASGGAGGGMRWPNRNPHRLTTGMREAQRSMAGFLELVDWTRFRRRPVEVACSDPGVVVFACADEAQAVLFLLRTGLLLEDGRVDGAVRPGVGFLAPCGGEAVFWDPVAGRVLGRGVSAGWVVTPGFGGCLAVALRAGTA